MIKINKCLSVKALECNEMEGCYYYLSLIPVDFNSYQMSDNIAQIRTLKVVLPDLIICRCIW